MARVSVRMYKVIPPSVPVLGLPAIYNLAARSITSYVQNLRAFRANLWTSGSLPPFSDRPIVGVLENHQLTDLLVWALAELRRGYSLIELRSKMAGLLFGGSVIYCTGICECSSKCTVTVKVDMNRTAALSRFIAAQ